MTPSDLQFRPLPHNLEAESALLGILLFDNEKLEAIGGQLRPEHFHEPYHQAIFHALRSEAGAGRLADPTLIAGTLVSHPAHQDYGGYKYLAALMEKSPPAPAARDYARQIYDLAVRRDLSRLGDSLKVQAHNFDQTAVAHIADAEGVLFGLAESGDKAQAIVPFAAASARAVAMAEAAFKRDGKLSGISTGLVDLDRKLGGLHPSDLLILAGRPSMGKTALATNIAFHVARSYVWEPDDGAPSGRRTVDGGRVFFGSLEMSAEQLAARILSERSGVPGDRIRKGEADAHEIRLYADAATELSSIPLFIDPTGGINIQKFCARARRHHRQHGIDLIVVDYLQLMTTDLAGGNRTQEVGIITGALKALAKELNVPVLALSQLSRQVEQREDKRPMLSDLRESGSIEQDADCVMFVYRDAYYQARKEPRENTPEHLAWSDEMAHVDGLAEVIVGKQRHGPIGTVRLSFDEDTTKFGNLGRDDRYGHTPSLSREPVYSFAGGGQ
ncbi:replicative DNA helicase [Brevundimonas sp. S30B]|uniref:replicative DNA helicase n=1 Tax=unclassified Brevundimonas TaxID=2622653 RepID=UPI0010717685|nr:MULTISPECIES: replicative DNA helicase [unclassified Brevundimonas]QBX37238.1 replicative DNA helicase [Brevundimonas sp. MF30-B]TFW03969.1 replicative DNA helicase [Brevundimonas sp. S30B]